MSCAVTLVREAASRGATLTFSYVDNEGKRTVRTVDSPTVHARYGAIYVRGWCRLRGAERTFRADRMQLLRVDDLPAPPALRIPPKTPAPRLEPRVAAPQARSGSGFGGCVGVAVGLAITFAIFGGSHSPNALPPAPQPMPAVYRPQPLPPARPGPAGRTRAFREATGIASEALERLYAEADGNLDGDLDWSEVVAFQKALWDRYSYRENTPALRPDEFLAEGSGDCEDWALVTAGLLQFWGKSAYVGSFAPDRGSGGHAVCLVLQSARPAGKAAFELRGWRAEDGTALADGWYVPIDYYRVGGLTSAVKAGWQLVRVYRPTAIYGRTM